MLVTGLSASLTVRNTSIIQYIDNLQLGILLLFFGILIAAIVLARSINQLHPAIAALMLGLSAIVTGIFITSIYMIITNGFSYVNIGTLSTDYSIGQTFFIAAILFGIMSVYGFVLKQDLSHKGNIGLLALIGIGLAWLATQYLFTNGYVIYVSVVLLTLSWLTLTRTIRNNYVFGKRDKAIAWRGALFLYLIFIMILSVVAVIMMKGALQVASANARAVQNIRF